MGDETRPPFGAVVEKAKSVTETPTYKMISWIFPKVGWLLVLWSLWSLRTYAEGYIRNSPIIQEHSSAIAQGEARIKMAEVHADVQNAQIAAVSASQREVSDALKEINKTNQQIQLNLAIMTERASSLDNRVNSLEHVRNRTNPE